MRKKKPAKKMSQKKRNELAMSACHALMDAYVTGDHNGGSVDWSDIDAAVEIAKKATRRCECCDCAECA